MIVCRRPCRERKAAADTIVQTAENWIEKAVQLVETEAAALGTQAVVDGKLLWNAFSAIWQTLAPSEWAIIEPIIQEAITDAFNGDFGDLEQVVLQKAELAGVDFLKKLDSAALQAVLALLHQVPMLGAIVNVFLWFVGLFLKRPAPESQ